jgi:hypothetical protein
VLASEALVISVVCIASGSSCGYRVGSRMQVLLPAPEALVETIVYWAS